jgi:hypothetical protein
MSSIGGSQLAFLTITDGQSTNCAAPPADTRRVCACTFYLVFKEPDDLSPCDTDRLQGNLPILLNALALVKRLAFFRRLPPSLLPGDGRAEKCVFGSVRRTAPNPPTIRSRGSHCQPPRESWLRARTRSIPIASLAIKQLFIERARLTPPRRQDNGRAPRRHTHGPEPAHAPPPAAASRGARDAG